MQETASSENKPPDSVGFIVHDAVPNGSETEETKPSNRPMRPVGMVMMLSVIDKVEIQHIKVWGDAPQNTGNNKKSNILLLAAGVSHEQF